MPPTAGFRTTLGRTFRLIKIDNDTCLAISSEKYDKRVKEKLLQMQKQGEALVDSAINGLTMLSFEERDDMLRTKVWENRGIIDG